MRGRRLYPWYDSTWLERYEEAKRVLGEHRPDAVAALEQLVAPFRTRPDFEVVELDRVLTDDVMSQLLQVVDGLRPSDLELHEARRFGRFVVHDHPFVSELQEQLVDLVSGAVGEPVEPSYNFLSLYTKRGVCGLHLDAPQAKYTLDLCLRQSGPWPIHVSDVVPWPGLTDLPRDDWEAAVRSSSEVVFTSFELEPGGAIIFSGSSQWHYRDPIPGQNPSRFCDLLFFHFIPMGTRHAVNPGTWGELLEAPELADLRESFAPVMGS